MLHMYYGVSFVEPCKAYVGDIRSGPGRAVPPIWCVYDYFESLYSV